MDELDNAVSIDEYCYSHDIDDYDLYGQIMEGDNDEDDDCDIKFEQLFKLKINMFFIEYV